MKKKLLLLSALLLAVVTLQAQEAGKYYRLSIGRRSLFVNNASPNPGTSVLLWTDTNVAAQRWLLCDLGNGLCSFKNGYTDLFLVSNGSRSAGVKLVQRAESSVSRLGSWYLEPVEGKEDVYRIYISADKELLLQASSQTDGADVVLTNPEDAVPTLSQWTVTADDDVHLTFDEYVRDAVMNGFITQYYKQAGTGHVLARGGFWGDAEMFESILDAFETTGDKTYQTYFDELYKNFVSRNSGDWSGNEYNDDISWMVLACIRGYKFFGTSDYLTKAKTNFDKMYARAKQPYGTLIWKQSQENKLSTNSCVNCPATVAACYLGQLTGDSTYFDKALSIYAGQRKLLFEASTGRVYDSRAWTSTGGMSSDFNTWASTYNQGTMLGSALMLYDYTKNPMYKEDAEKIYEYTVTHMTDNNGIISVCQTIQGDLTNFKGIFMRYARRYAQELRHQEALDWMAKNAFRAYQNRMSKGVIWSAWLTKTTENLQRQEGESTKNISNDADGASTAVSVAFNAHINTMFEKNAFDRIGVEYFDDIKWLQIASTTSDEGRPETTAAKTGAYIGFRNVNFGMNEADKLYVRAKATASRNQILVYADSISASSLIGTSAMLEKPWADNPIDITPITGVHDIFLVFNGSGSTIMGSMKFASSSQLYSDLTDNGGTLVVNGNYTDDYAVVDDNANTTQDLGSSLPASLVYFASQPMTIMGYALLTSKNEASALPSAWTLEGSTDGEQWTVIDQQSGVEFGSHGSKKTFNLATAATYQRLRLTVTAASGSGNVEIADWQLYGQYVTGYDVTDEGGVLKVEGIESNEAALIDNNLGTAPVFSGQTATFIYEATSPYVIENYTLTIGEGDTGHPMAWTFSVSDNGTSWTKADQRSAMEFLYPHSTIVNKVSEAGKHKYFKLEITKTADGAPLNLAEWQLNGHLDYGMFYNDLTTLLGAKTASDGSDASALFDNNGSTVASVSGENKWWQYESPIEGKLRGYSIVAGPNPDKFPTKITIQGSNDGTTWQDLTSATLKLTNKGERVDTQVSDAGYKFYRLVVDEVADGGNTAELAEWEIHTLAITTDESQLVAVASVDPSTRSSLCDGSESTSYSGAFKEVFETTYQLAEPVAVKTYSLTIPRSYPERDLSDWTLQASEDGVNFVTIDRQKDVVFAARTATQFYACNPEGKAYSYYRLSATKAAGGGSSIQLTEWQLLKLDATTAINNVNAKAQQALVWGEAGKAMVSLQEKANIAIYNAQGMMEHGGSYGAGNHAFDLPKGLHIVTVRDGQSTKALKIVVR